MKSIIETFKHLVDWISEKINKYGMRQTFMSVMLVIIMIAFLSGYADRIVRGVGDEMHTDKIEQFENHQDLWLQSRDIYMEVKTIMRQERPLTNADYILFLEYHNGSENIATGYSFCKFDVSISVRSDTVPVLPIEDFRDENIWTWDMLLTDEVIHRKMTSVTLERALEIDPGMMHRIHPNEHTQFVVFYNIMANDICAGTMMFLYSNHDLVDYGAITTCGANVEKTINNALQKRRDEAMKKSRR